MNEMNEDYGFSYFNFEDKHTNKTQVTQEAIHSMIEWHDNITQMNVNSIVPTAHHFGILNVSTPKTPISTTPLAILLNIDGSSSMDEIGSDKLTKINHIKHTLKNMIHILIEKITETPDICIYISIMLFTHDTKNLLQRIKSEKQFDHYFKGDFVLLNHHSMHIILEEIERIRPWGCTNIEISLKNAKTAINDFMQQNPSFRIAHIQLTDGQATVGKKRANELSPYVDISYRNVFVGYGEDHDGHLLASLGEIYPTCDYRFIDSIERTGLVYGEIIYHLLYPHNDLPILIKMSPGTKIYNWKTNQWSSTLMIPPLSSDTEKVFQIIIDDSSISKEDVWADLYYTNNIQTPIETAITLPSLITLPIKINNLENSSGDLRSPSELVVRRLQGTEAHQSTESAQGLRPHLGVSDPLPNSSGDKVASLRAPSVLTDRVSSEEASVPSSPLPEASSEKYESSEIGEKLPVDLTKYLLRQLTQECLYLVRYHALNDVDAMYPPPPLIRSTNQVSSYPDPLPLIRSTNQVSSYPDPLPLIRNTNQVSPSIAWLKYKLSLNINLLLSYRDAQNTDDDDVLFIQTLIDDLQTALTNLGSKHSFMYTAARQTSQGSQHTYSPYKTHSNDEPFAFRTGSGAGREDLTNTFDLYNCDVVQHNQRQTSYANSDILNMMTQLQDMDNSMYVSDVENDITDSLDNLSQEPVVYNTHVHIPPNFSGDSATFEVSSDEATRNVSPLPIIRMNSVNSDSTVNTLFTQLMTDDISDEE